MDYELTSLSTMDVWFFYLSTIALAFALHLAFRRMVDLYLSEG